MPWPDIFFKARKTSPVPPVPPPFIPAPETPKPIPGGLQPPAIKPVPVALGPKAVPAPVQAKVTPVTTSTRTLPAMHGVILRPPVRPATSTMKISSPATAPSPPAEPIKNIDQLMAEADPVRTLSQSGSVRMLKRLAPEPDAASVPADTTPASSETAPVSIPPLEAAASNPGPAPATTPEPAAPVISTPVPAPDESTTPFLLEPAPSTTRIPRVYVAPPPPPADALWLDPAPAARK